MTVGGGQLLALMTMPEAVRLEALKLLVWTVLILSGCEGYFTILPMNTPIGRLVGTIRLMTIGAMLALTLQIWSTYQ